MGKYKIKNNFAEIKFHDHKTDICHKENITTLNYQCHIIELVYTSVKFCQEFK